MPVLPRTSLTSLVCLSTPFLAQKPIRTLAPIALLPARSWTATACLQRPSYATKARQNDNKNNRGRNSGPISGLKKKGKNGLSADEVGQLPSLKQLRVACDTRNVLSLMDLYPSLAASGMLDRTDTRRIARALHAHVRNIHLTGTRLSDLFIFVQRVVSDTQEGVLPPHPYAFVHLLGIYKECEKFQEGYALWEWLVQRDETFVSQAVYGAAIELMAYGGMRSLEDLEDLYASGLKRFPGTFAEYHLSPDAIVLDRSQPVPLIDLPVLLLQGILTARILARDWRNAYLALDTALRLFPGQLPTRYFELFMTERPLPEAYTAYLVACRAGIVFKPSHLTALIKKLREDQAGSTHQQRMMTLRAVANAIYAYLEAGGTLEAVHVGAFLRTFEVLLPEKGHGQDYAGEEAEVRNIIVATAHEFMSIFIQAGLLPSSHMFIALIGLAGKYRVPNLLQVSLQDIQTSRVDIGEIGTRTILGSAGRLGNKELLQEYWTRIASQAEAEGKPISYGDWITFVRTCRNCDHLVYFKEQLRKFDHTVSTALKQRLTYHAESDEFTETQTLELMEKTLFTSEIELLRDQVKNIAAVVMSGQPLDLRRDPFYMFRDPKRPSLGSQEDLRIVYDELTTDPHQPVAQRKESAIPVSISSTGIPLDELRFQNWVSVVEMMNQAAFHEEYLEATISRQTTYKQPTVAITDGMSIPVGQDQTIHSLPLDALRARIKQLRAPTLPSPPTFRKTASEHQTVKDLKYKPDNIATTEKTYSLTPAPSLVRGHPQETPSIHSYVRLESDHVAQKPSPTSSISRKPFRKRSSPHHHALGLQPRPSSNQLRSAALDGERVQNADATTSTSTS